MRIFKATVTVSIALGERMIIARLLINYRTQSRSLGRGLGWGLKRYAIIAATKTESSRSMPKILIYFYTPRHPFIRTIFNVI